MAKRNDPRRARAYRFGQLMWLAGALMNTQLCLAEQDSDDLSAGQTAVAEPSSRELLLYLGEFDPELDPLEVSQMNELPQTDQEVATDTNTATEAGAHAANEPKI